VEQLGFERVSGHRRLQSKLKAPPEAARFPPNLSLKTYSEVQSGNLLAQALQQSYEGLWGHKYPTKELVDLVLATFPHDAIFLLLDGSDRLAGICAAAELPSQKPGRATVGYIDAPGVTAPHRTPAAYVNLARSALNWLYQRGNDEITLDSWGDPGEVVASYGQLGFELETESHGYVLHI
jgi:hypothetical protein